MRPVMLTPRQLTLRTEHWLSSIRFGKTNTLSGWKVRCKALKSCLNGQMLALPKLLVGIRSLTICHL
eukprot:8031169-Alexandrium_andersonii.AAC.1